MKIFEGKLRYCSFIVSLFLILGVPSLTLAEEIRGWRYPGGNILNTRYYPYSPSGEMPIFPIYKEWELEVGGSFTGDVDGDGELEIVGLQKKEKYEIVLTDHDMSSRILTQIDLRATWTVSLNCLADVGSDTIPEIILSAEAPDLKPRLLFYSGTKRGGHLADK